MVENEMITGQYTPLRRFFPHRHISSLTTKLVLLTAVGIAVRLLFLTQPLQGDEYNSLQTASTWGSQLNGWLYYIVLHIWSWFGSADWWYRLPSIVIGAAAIPLAFYVGILAINRRVGFTFAALTALSPYAVELSLRIRHYGFYLTASLFVLGATLYYLKQPRDRRRLWLLASALLLVTLSHLFGIILAATLILYIYLQQGRWPSRSNQRAVLLGTLLVLGLSILMWPAARNIGWEWLLDAIGALNEVDYQSPRGLSLAQFAKIGITFYVFALGYDVYPLQWLIVIPAFLILGASCLSSFQILHRSHRVLLVIILLCLVPFVLLVLEPLVPPLTETVGPRHLALAWPAFGLFLAAGASHAYRHVLTWLILVLCVIGIGLGHYGNWSYGLSGPDWKAASAFAQDHHLTGEVALIHDGRSAQPVEYYFPEDLTRISLWSIGTKDNVTEPLTYERLILTTNDYKPENRRRFNDTLWQLERSFIWAGGYVDYPFFEYILLNSDTSGYPVDETTGQISQPLRMYGTEFQDLQLPVNLTFPETKITILGSFFLPDLSNQRQQDIPLQAPVYGDQLLFLTNVLDSHTLAPGTEIAELAITTEDGETWSLPIRIGYETESWSRECSKAAACSTAHGWQKRVALVGQRSYSDAWQQFQARIHAAPIPFPEPARVEHISIRYLQDTGQLYIWGMAILP